MVGLSSHDTKLFGLTVDIFEESLPPKSKRPRLSRNPLRCRRPHSGHPGRIWLPLPDGLDIRPVSEKEGLTALNTEVENSVVSVNNRIEDTRTYSNVRNSSSDHTPPMYLEASSCLTPLLPTMVNWYVRCALLNTGRQCKAE